MISGVSMFFLQFSSFAALCDHDESHSNTVEFARTVDSEQNANIEMHVCNVQYRCAFESVEFIYVMSPNNAATGLIRL